jgi:transposase InsO family protein
MKSRLAVQALENAARCAATSPAASCIRTGDLTCSRKMPAPQPTPHGREHGKSRAERRQRRHGIVLRAAAEERPRPPPWTTREQLRIAMVTWIERTYHRRRRQARLGRLTPIEFETIMNTTVALAA